MSREDEVRKISELIIGTAQQSSEVLNTLIESVIKALEAILTPIYRNNRAALEALVADPMNPMLAEQADESIKPYIEALQNIHRDADKVNEKISKLHNAVTLLQGQGPVDPQFKEKIELQLNELIGRNNQYKKTASLLQKQAMILGKSDFADPAQKHNLDQKLAEVQQRVNELKAQTKEKLQIVNKVEKYTSPKPK